MYYFEAITSHVFFKKIVDQKMEIYARNCVDLIYTYFKFFKIENARQTIHLHKHNKAARL